MTTEMMLQFKKAMEAETILEGQIRLIEYKGDDEVLSIECEKEFVKMKKEDFDLVVKGSLTRHVGKKIKFLVKGIEDDVVYADRKTLKMKEREAFIQELEKDPDKVYEGRIVSLHRYGAYLSINGVNVSLRNVDFSNDYTTVEDRHKVGDVLKVHFLKISENDKILVRAVEKYQEDTLLSFDSFEVGQVVHGKIRSMKPFGCFVCIAPGVDVLASIPVETDFEVTEGTSVLIRLSKIDQVERRIRGKIVKTMGDDSDYILD